MSARPRASGTGADQRAFLRRRIGAVRWGLAIGGLFGNVLFTDLAYHDALAKGMSTVATAAPQQAEGSSFFQGQGDNATTAAPLLADTGTASATTNVSPATVDTVSAGVSRERLPRTARRLQLVR